MSPFFLIIPLCTSLPFRTKVGDGSVAAGQLRVLTRVEEIFPRSLGVQNFFSCAFKELYIFRQQLFRLFISTFNSFIVNGVLRKILSQSLKSLEILRPFTVFPFSVIQSATWWRNKVTISFLHVRSALSSVVRSNISIALTHFLYFAKLKIWKSTILESVVSLPKGLPSQSLWYRSNNIFATSAISVSIPLSTPSQNCFSKDDFQDFNHNLQVWISIAPFEASKTPANSDQLHFQKLNLLQHETSLYLKDSIGWQA